MPTIIPNVEQARIEWRDNLLSKYESRIRELERLLELAGYYVVHLPQTEVLREEIQRVLSKKVGKEE